MPESSDLVVCPPDRQLLVDYLQLKSVLAGELALVADEAARSQVQQLLLLLELITHVEYMQVSHTVKSAMAATKPVLSADEAAAWAAMHSTSVQQQEQVLLDTLVGLLLEGRYSPLSAEEWAVAQCNEFTFDIPVQIDWRVLDQQLLAHFWERREQAAAAAKTDSNGSSGFGWLGSLLGGSTAVAGSGVVGTSSQASDALLDRSQLPDFFDRMLVFHRGMGVATAEGLYLDKKLDLLVAYLLVAPASSALARLRAEAAAWLARAKRAAAGDAAAPSTVPPFVSAVAAAAKAVVDKVTVVQQQQQPAVGPPDKVSTATWRSMPQQDEASAADDDDNEDNGGKQQQQQQQQRQQLPPSAAADLSHQYARLVARRSLRSEMPGPRQVLAKLAAKVTLLEPTFRDVVVLYRANTQEAAASAAASAAQAAESAMAAAVTADSGSSSITADSLVGAARAAAGARSSTSSRSKDDHPNQRQQQQQVPVQSQLDVSRRVGLNPNNVIIKSFSDVAVADLELVFPAKKAEVLPTTIVRSAVTALGAVGAAVAAVQQAGDMQWSLPVIVPAAAVVAGRALRALATVRSNQAKLASVMMQMQYDAARDSQEGVAVKLIDELQEQHLKEAAVAYMVMLAQDVAIREQQQQQQQHAPAVFSAGQIDAACEDFLLQRFGLKVNFTVEETLPRLLAWGLLRQQAGPQQYSLVPLQQAVDNMTRYWQSMQQPAEAADSGSETPAQRQTYSLLAGPADVAGGSGSLRSPAAGAAGRVPARCMGPNNSRVHHGGGCVTSSGRGFARRMPVQQLQARRLVPCCVGRVARSGVAAAAAARVRGPAAAGRLNCWA